MPHVEDALLVAYADDALDAAGRAQVETHLASCAECRARVAEERALAARAAEVLGRGTPELDTAVPPFAEIARRGEQLHATPGGGAAGAPPRRRNLPPLAWAAMLVVGLGAAWIARTLLVSPAFNAPADAIRAERMESTAAEAAPAEPPATGAAGVAGATEEADARKAGVAADASIADEATVAAREAADATAQVDVETARLAPQTLAAPPPPAPAPPAEAPVPLGEPVSQRYADAAGARDSAQRGDTSRVALRAPAAAAAAAPAAARAESVAAGGIIAGVVRDATTNQPLAGGQVMIEGTAVGTITDARGAFVLRNVPAGTQTLRVALIGYGAENREVTVAADQVMTTEVTLARAAVSLDAITITGAPAAAADIEPDDAAWVGASAAAAAARGEAVRGITGAPVELVWLGRPTAPWRARVVQRVDGVALEVIEWRSPVAAAGTSGTLGDGRGYLFTTSDGVSVLLRGRISPDRLRALAERLARLP